MIDWFVIHPWLTGVATFFLMWGDWLLTILQERERILHYAEHYQSYPINTIEGSPLYQSPIKARRIAEPRHLIPALILSALVAYALVWIPEIFQVAFIGYVWGLFLIVDTTHLGNIIGYRAGRRGLHGKQFLHLRTDYLIQMGRYLALTVFISVLAVCSASPFIVGVAIAGMTSTIRQFLWLRRIPAIDSADEPPVT
ncbi:MAG: hypothetical protein M1281_15810 [Chloroflexi bacterium]|nr:hypothetical protein [Chloroflexota bacterium]